ncbi:MAG: Zn-dependent hydrolase [Saprospiraceae bacterium]|nr:Zn-dependent hydrolase [Saprospiraceae bacterium]
MKPILFIFLTLMIFNSCKNGDKKTQMKTNGEPVYLEPSIDVKKELTKYTNVKLTADLSSLSENEKQMLRLFIKAAEIMDTLFWYEAYGDREEILGKISDPDLRKYTEINYGPWDRLNGNASFIKEIGNKPAGANYYPEDMTKEEFEKSTLADKENLYTFIRRDAEGNLISVPYHIQFKEQVNRAADLLIQASKLTTDAGLIRYLTLRASALKDDNYFNSDIAWMDMKTNKFDLVIGPIENYEDQIFGYKTAHEAYVLVKDMEWSEKLKKFAKFMPELQSGLPVPAKYKAEKPGGDAQLNAYDILYYAGDCNAGSKTIAINLPNDEKVQLEKGTRRLQLKNAMKAKFDNILMPIAEVLIEGEQKKNINFDAFFSNTMFHEVAHGLGIKNTLTGKGPVRKVLKDYYSTIEEGKADILGLYMIQQLHKKGEIKGELKEFYTTFMAGIIRSIRFGTSSAHGKANMVCFNFFNEQGAFSRSKESGKYMINIEKFEAAIKALSNQILVLQGDGDYEKVRKFIDKYNVMNDTLKKDIEILKQKSIPVDVVFEQGVKTLGL